MNFKEFKYSGVPLTPAIKEELILQLFNGRFLERQTIVEEVLAFHESRGGITSKAIDVPCSLKKALNKLKAKGLAENPSYRFWRIDERQSPAEQGHVELVNALPQIIVEPEPQADLILGEAKRAVYIYYPPLYKLKAQSEKEVFWPSKIGRTDRDPLQRVSSQASMAIPEKPLIALIIKTDFASDLESAWHGILSVRNRRIDSAPGTEWFLTSPDEILQIIDFIIPEINSPKQQVTASQAFFYIFSR